MNTNQLLSELARAVEATKPAQEYCFLWIDSWPTCMTKSEWSGWMQAFGSVAAIVGSVLLTERQIRHDREATELAAQRDKEATELAAQRDRRKKIVRTTHHLIAITMDLKGRVDHVKKVLTDGKYEGKYPVSNLEKITESIEKRYETLLEPDAYEFLPGPTVNLIVRMSGSIFGLTRLADGIAQSIKERSGSALTPVPVNHNQSSTQIFDNIMSEIQELIDQLVALRKSIDVDQGGT